MSAVGLHFFQPCSHRWIPKSDYEKAKNIAIGVLAGLGLSLLVTVVGYVVYTYSPQLRISQDALRLFKLFSKTHPLLHKVWCAALRLFVVFIGPVIEEVIFRGWLDRGVKKLYQEDSALKKVVRIAFVAILFGAAHLSPFQTGLSNALLFSITATAGVAFGLLKEWRQNLIAPTVAHITFNLIGTL